MPIIQNVLRTAPANNDRYFSTLSDGGKRESLERHLAQSRKLQGSKPELHSERPATNHLSNCLVT